MRRDSANKRKDFLNQFQPWAVLRSEGCLHMYICMYLCMYMHTGCNTTTTKVEVGHQVWDCKLLNS